MQFVINYEPGSKYTVPNGDGFTLTVGGNRAGMLATLLADSIKPDVHYFWLGCLDEVQAVFEVICRVARMKVQELGACLGRDGGTLGDLVGHDQQIFGQGRRMVNPETAQVRNALSSFAMMKPHPAQTDFSVGQSIVVHPRSEVPKL